MFRTVSIFVVSLLVSAHVFAAEPGPHAPAASAQSVPIERGLPDADACYGASNEKDEDLKTGNEELVQRLLQQMLSPGS